MWTPGQFVWFPDKHAVADASSDYGPLAKWLYHDISSPGLGSGLIPPTKT